MDDPDVKLVVPTRYAGIHHAIPQDQTDDTGIGTMHT